MQHRESEVETVAKEYPKISAIILPYTSLASKIQLEKGSEWRYYRRLNCWYHASTSRLDLMFTSWFNYLLGASK